MLKMHMAKLSLTKKYHKTWCTWISHTDVIYQGTQKIAKISEGTAKTQTDLDS